MSPVAESYCSQDRLASPSACNEFAVKPAFCKKGVIVKTSEQELRVLKVISFSSNLIIASSLVSTSKGLGEIQNYTGSLGATSY